MIASIRLGTLTIFFLTNLPTSQPWNNQPIQAHTRRLISPPTLTYVAPMRVVSSLSDDSFDSKERTGEVHGHLDAHSFELCPKPTDRSREAEAWRAVDMPTLVNRVARHASTIPGAEQCLHGACLASSAEAAQKQYAVVAEALDLLATDTMPPLEHDLDLAKSLGSTFSSNSAVIIDTDDTIQRSANLGLAELAQVDGAVKALKALALWSKHPTTRKLAPQLAACVDFDFDAQLAKLYDCLHGAIANAPSDRSKPQDGTPPKLQLASRKWPALDAARNRETSLRSEVGLRLQRSAFF